MTSGLSPYSALSLDRLLQSIVRHRKEKAVLGWKAWILEDPSAHPYRWLRPDLVPPSLFCSVILGILLVGLVLLLTLLLSMLSFGRLGCLISLGLPGALLI